MRVAFFDDAAGHGHHIDYLPSLVRGCTELGHHPIVFAPDELHAHLPDVDFHPTPNLVGWSYYDPAAHKKRLAAAKMAVDACRSARADVFIDTDYGRHFSVASRFKSAAPRRFLILHGVWPFIPRRPQYRRADRLSRPDFLALRRHVRGDTSIVTHTTVAYDRLVKKIPARKVRLVRLPYNAGGEVVRLPPLPPQRRPWAPGTRPVVALAGNVFRSDKDIDTLWGALAHLPQPVDISIVGPQDPTGAKPTEIEGSTVTWTDRELSRSEVNEAYAKADLAVFIHNERFRSLGRASGALLDAIVTATPSVVASSVADLLPPEYPGAITYDVGSATSLAEAIDHLLSNHPIYVEGAAMDRARAMRGAMPVDYLTQLLGQC